VNRRQFLKLSFISFVSAGCSLVTRKSDHIEPIYGKLGKSVQQSVEKDVYLPVILNTQKGLEFPVAFPIAFA